MKDISGYETLESMSQAVWYNHWTLQKFQNFLHGDILEIGCGIGNFTQTLSQLGKVTAVDINSHYTRELKRKLGNKVKVGLGDIETGQFFFKKKEFDVIVCINVLEHIQNDQAALANIYKLLKKEGFLILIVPAHDFLYGQIDRSIGHFRRYDKKVLKEKLVQTGFKITKVRILNFLGAIGWFLFSRVFKNERVEEKKIRVFNIFAPFLLSMENLIEPPIGTSVLIIAQK